MVSYKIKSKLQWTPDGKKNKNHKKQKKEPKILKIIQIRNSKKKFKKKCGPPKDKKGTREMKLEGSIYFLTA